MKYLISGGGTGGHIFPAVSIANALKELDPDAKILFVGALGRMEMERVPQAGYDIVGLPVRGFNRAQPWKNVSVLMDLAKSLRQVKAIIKDFRPDVGVGVGGYASGAAMWQASKMGIPILLQEQNGFAGVTNKILKNKAAKICVAYEGMERFFPADKIILTGNPVRQNLLNGERRKAKRIYSSSAVRSAHAPSTRPSSLVCPSCRKPASTSSGKQANTTTKTSNLQSPISNLPSRIGWKYNPFSVICRIGMPMPTSSSAVPVPRRSANSVCSANPLSSCHLPTWPKIIRPITPWHSFAKTPPCSSKTAMPLINSFPRRWNSLKTMKS